MGWEWKRSEEGERECDRGEGGGARNRSNPDEDVVSGTEPRFSINHMATQ